MTTRMTPTYSRLTYRNEAVSLPNFWHGLFQTLIACDTLAFDRWEVTIEAAPQLANRGRRRVSYPSAELGIVNGSEPGTRFPSGAAAG
jgi:hypothetical protein